MQPHAILRMAPYPFEFEPAVGSSILSRIRVDILVHRAEGATYRKLYNGYRLCNQEALSQCFVRTELGFHWLRAARADPYHFCPISTFTKLKELPSNNAHNLIF
jgi:hypothetical protein